nr:MAG TPA: hypothetical protein [Caudoviricetes sp.]
MSCIQEMRRIKDLTNEELLATYSYWKSEKDNLNCNPNYSEVRKKFIKEQFEKAEKEALKRMGGFKNEQN